MFLPIRRDHLTSSLISRAFSHSEKKLSLKIKASSSMSLKKVKEVWLELLMMCITDMRLALIMDNWLTSLKREKQLISLKWGILGFMTTIRLLWGLWRKARLHGLNFQRSITKESITWALISKASQKKKGNSLVMTSSSNFTYRTLKEILSARIKKHSKEFMISLIR